MDGSGSASGTKKVRIGRCGRALAHVDTEAAQEPRHTVGRCEAVSAKLLERQGRAKGKFRLISGAGEAGTSKSSLPAWLAGGSGTSRTRYQLSTLVP
jgi:hypothetical protein